MGFRFRKNQRRILPWRINMSERLDLSFSFQLTALVVRWKLIAYEKLNACAPFYDLIFIWKHIFFQSFNTLIWIGQSDEQLSCWSDVLRIELNFWTFFDLTISFGSIFLWLGCVVRKMDDHFQLSLWPILIILSKLAAILENGNWSVISPCITWIWYLLFGLDIK